MDLHGQSPPRSKGGKGVMIPDNKRSHLSEQWDIVDSDPENDFSNGLKDKGRVRVRDFKEDKIFVENSSLIDNGSMPMSFTVEHYQAQIVPPMSVESSIVQEYTLNAWERHVTVGALEGLKNINCYVFGFKNAEDSKWALDNAPRCVKGYTLVLSSWTPRVGNEYAITSLKVWVQFHLLPREYFSKENGELSGAQAGKVLSVDFSDDTPAAWSNCLRAHVEINIEDPLVSGCFFDLSDGVKRWVQFKYEKIGIFCFHCGRLGHQRRGCGLSSPDTILNLVGIPFPHASTRLFSNSSYSDPVGPGVELCGEASVGFNMANGHGSSSINAQETNVIFYEGRVLSNFFQAQDTFLQELKMFGNLDLFEIKNLGGDIGVKTSSEQNERTTPIKKRKMLESSTPLHYRPWKIQRPPPKVVRDFPLDREARIVSGHGASLSEERSGQESSDNLFLSLKKDYV
uniref:CCHC-type domain-containing protein n=1 Tax=Cannabis sativa TaxID=3483 RepID=A0A803PSC8_CANSA